MHVFQHLLSMLLVMSFGKERFYMCLLRNKYQCEYRHLYFVYSRCWIVIVKMSHFVEFQNCEKKALWTLWKDNAAEDGILPKTMKWNFTSVNKNSSERQTLRFRLKYVNCKRFIAVVLSVLTIFLDRKLNIDIQSTNTL